MHFLKLKGKKEIAAGPSQYSTGNTYYINKFSECVCFPPHPAYIIIKKIDPNKKKIKWMTWKLWLVNFANHSNMC